jgi:hypothetical protein
MVYNDNYEMTENRKPGYNMRLAQWRVQWLVEHCASHRLLWYVDSSVLRKPPLRQALYRYSQFPKTVWKKIIEHLKNF